MEVLNFKVVQQPAEKNLKNTIKKALENLGGVDKFVKKGEIIFLKPNFNTADPPPASLDPLFIKAVAEICLEGGAKKVIVGDSSTFYLPTRTVMEKLKIFELEKELGIKVLVLDEEKWITKKIKNGKYLKKATIPKILEEVDKIFLLPSLKTHRYAQFTGSLKLAVGFLKKRERLALHFSYLQEKIAELNLLFQPSLIIMDARQCFINQGPEKGEIKYPNLILASESRVALDIAGIKIIQKYQNNSLEGFNPLEIPQIKRAIELGIK